jgi:hypothetical protein
MSMSLMRSWMKLRMQNYILNYKCGTGLNNEGVAGLNYEGGAGLNYKDRAGLNY